MPRILYTPHKFGEKAERIIRLARGICDEYAAQGYDLTLRQLYYQFVARGYIPNKHSEYKRLGDIINDARLAGLIDWDHLVDRTRDLEDLAHWRSPQHIIDIVAQQFRLAKWNTQPTRVEVWVEKEALAGVVERICNELDVPYFSCRGYVSQSEMWKAGQRFGEAMKDRDQDVLILHLGDHDPSGIDMSRDIEDRLKMFLAKDHKTVASGIAMEVQEKRHPELVPLMYSDWPQALQEAAQGAYEVLRAQGWERRLEVRRIALNYDQVEQYNPPPNPTKLTDSRAQGYIDAHGYESWELDALDPPVLAALIEDHVLGARDEELWDEVVVDEDEHKRLLRQASSRWPEIVELLS